VGLGPSGTRPKWEQTCARCDTVGLGLGSRRVLAAGTLRSFLGRVTLSCKELLSIDAPCDKWIKVHAPTPASRGMLCRVGCSVARDTLPRIRSTRRVANEHGIGLRQWRCRVATFTSLVCFQLQKRSLRSTVSGELHLRLEVLTYPPRHTRAPWYHHQADFVWPRRQPASVLKTKQNKIKHKH
jgi:hypothetical protein